MLIPVVTSEQTESCLECDSPLEVHFLSEILSCNRYTEARSNPAPVTECWNSLNECAWDFMLGMLQYWNALSWSYLVLSCQVTHHCPTAKPKGGGCSPTDGSTWSSRSAFGQIFTVYLLYVKHSRGAWAQSGEQHRPSPLHSVTLTSS